MKQSNKGTVYICLICLLLLSLNASAQDKIVHYVLGNGGYIVPTGHGSIAATLGQPVVGMAIDSSRIIKTGFWQQSIGYFTGIEIAYDELPVEFRLEQNFPNPFNPSTVIRFFIPEPTLVKLMLYDALGRTVYTLVDRKMERGRYDAILDGTSLASGVYFYRLQAGAYTEAKKLVLLK